jgi:hypothetical protein
MLKETESKSFLKVFLMSDKKDQDQWLRIRKSDIDFILEQLKKIKEETKQA